MIRDFTLSHRATAVVRSSLTLLLVSAVATVVVVTDLLAQATIVAVGGGLVAFSPQLMVQVRRFVTRTNRFDVAWILALSATMSVDTLSTDQVFSGALGTAQLLRLALVVSALLIVLPDLRSRLIAHRSGLRLPGLLRVYALFIAFAALSTLWSRGMLATAGKVLELGVAFAIVVAVASQPEARFLLRKLFTTTLVFMATLLVTVFLGYLVSPEVFSKYIAMAGRSVLDGGLLPVSSNAVARFGSFVALVSLAMAMQAKVSRSARLMMLASAAAFGAFPFLAEGRTGVVALLVGVVALVLLRWRLPALIGVAIVLVAVTPIVAEPAWQYFLRGQTEEQFGGLSGRLLWWNAALEVVRVEPWLGFGYGVGGRVAFSSIGNDLTSGLHNGALETLAGVGVVGALVWLVVVLTLSGQAVIALFRQQDAALNIVVVPLVLATLLSSGMGGWMSAELALFLLLLAWHSTTRSGSDAIGPCGASRKSG